MTLPIALVLVILAVTAVLFVTEWLPVDLVALLALLVLVLAGILPADRALAGFANPAVITVAAVLVLGGGLMKTGVAGIVGRQVMRFGSGGETRLVLVMMVTVAGLSAIMNNIGVSALLLPVVLEIARRMGFAPSKLLIPLAFASLLGGLLTLIGTAPNILLSGALEDAGLRPFGMFEFTPVGVAVGLLGIGYMATLGRRLLPENDSGRPRAAGERIQEVYDLERVLFAIGIPGGSPLAGRTLADSRLGAALGLTVLGIRRDGRPLRAPGPDTTLRSGDRLLVEGRVEQLRALRQWRNLIVKPLRIPRVEDFVTVDAGFARARVADGSWLAGKTLREADFVRRYGLRVLAIVRADRTHLTRLADEPVEAGDTVVVMGDGAHLEGLAESAEFTGAERLTSDEIARDYRLQERLIRVEIPDRSRLAGMTLGEARLGAAFGLVVLATERKRKWDLTPDPRTMLQGGDRMILQGDHEDLFVLHALQDVEIDTETDLALTDLESDEVGFAEVVLSPRSSLAGRTLRELDFREKYGLTVVALWRGERSYHSNLRVSTMELEFGDALIVFGPRRRLQILGRDADFLVLDEVAAEGVASEKAPVGAAIMLGVVASVAAGWLPIHVAAPSGAALMVLTGCLSTEDAYRFIEWRVVVLIAGMLGLGLAMAETGAAGLVARSALGSLAGLGPLAVLAGVFLIAAAACQIMPTAAVAVLMSPIALTTATDLGLDPRGLMMGVVVACSSAFLSPVGHPVNLLVMGLGGYRFRDYTRVGLPLVGIMFVVVLVLVPLLWPLRP